MQNVLDRFLEAVLHNWDSMDKRLTKSEHERLLTFAKEREDEFLSAIGLDLSVQSDSDKFDRILDLAEAYRKDEAQYPALVNYVESLR